MCMISYDFSYIFIQHLEALNLVMIACDLVYVLSM